MCVRVCVRETYCVCCTQYGVATVSRIDQIIGLFRRIASLLQGSFAKETYHFIDPTNRSKPITLWSTHSISHKCMCVYHKVCFLSGSQSYSHDTRTHTHTSTLLYLVRRLDTTRRKTRRMVSSLLQQNILSFIGLFCKRDLCKRDARHVVWCLLFCSRISSLL